MNRRSVSKCLLGAALGPFLRAQDPPKQDTSKLEIGGGVIEVTFAGTGFDLSQAAILQWAKDAADAVTWYFGRFPVPQAKLRIMLGRRGGVSNGTTFGEGGPRTRIAVGAHATEAELKDDWILTHEMVHYGFPSVEDNHHWIEEGSAVYIEPIARVHVGQLTPEKIWGDMVRDMPQGLPAAGDQGLDNTHTWARTYWGGALFCMLADIEIRKRTKNKKSLQDSFPRDQCSGWDCGQRLAAAARIRNRRQSYRRENVDGLVAADGSEADAGGLAGSVEAARCDPRGRCCDVRS